MIPSGLFLFILARSTGLLTARLLLVPGINATGVIFFGQEQHGEQVSIRRVRQLRNQILNESRAGW